MATEWIGAQMLNRPFYERGAADLTLRQHMLLRLLTERGRVFMGDGGHEYRWRTQVKLFQATGYADFDTPTYSAHNPFIEHVLGWRGFLVPHYYTEYQRLMNRGQTTLIANALDGLNICTESVREELGNQLFYDGNASGNERTIHGFESITGAVGSAVVGDKIEAPSDTYAGQSTVLGTNGGTWTANLAAAAQPSTVQLDNDFPQGTGDPSYHANSPLLVNWGYAWNGGNTWILNGERALRYTFNHVGRLNRGRPELALMSAAMFGDLQNIYSSRSQVNVAYRKGQDLGFPETLTLDGVMMNSAYAVPENTCYVFSPRDMELRCLGPKLIKTYGPDYVPQSFGHLVAAAFFGNLFFKKPKGFAKLYNYADQ